MPGTDVELVGLSAATQMLDEIFHRTRDYQPLLEGDMSRETRQFFVEQFATQGAAGGEPWAPLAQVTLEIRAKAGYGHEMLRRTDTLYNSLTQPDAPFSLQNVSEDALQFGTTDPAAADLQEGEGRMPPRAIIPDELPEQYTDRWSGLVLDYVEG